MCPGNACWWGGPSRSIAGWICRTGSGQRVVSRHWGEKQPCNLGAPIVTVDDMTPRWCCTGSSLARYRMTGGYRKGCCSPRAELATAPNLARCGSRYALTTMGKLDIELHSMYEWLMSETRAVGAAVGGRIGR